MEPRAPGWPVQFGELQPQFTELHRQLAGLATEGSSLRSQPGRSYGLSEVEGDHLTPWHAGGQTTDENLQLLCKDDNRRKSGK